MLLVLTTPPELIDGRKRLLEKRLVLLTDPLAETGNEALVLGAFSSLPAAPLVKAGRGFLVIAKGGRARWVNGLMLGVKVRLRKGPDSRDVTRPLLPSSSLSADC